LYKDRFDGYVTNIGDNMIRIVLKGRFLGSTAECIHGSSVRGQTVLIKYVVGL